DDVADARGRFGDDFARHAHASRPDRTYEDRVLTARLDEQLAAADACARDRGPDLRRPGAHAVQRRAWRRIIVEWTATTDADFALDRQPLADAIGLVEGPREHEVREPAGRCSTRALPGQRGVYDLVGLQARKVSRL